MKNFIGEYCKYKDINNFIATHCQNKRKYLEYRKKWKSNKNQLLFLCLETISDCNLKCPMCIHSVGYDRTQAMGDNLLNIIVENIKKMKIPSVCMNNTNEPLLDKKIFERINKVAKVDCVMDIHMNTNAILLNKENSLKILNSSLTRLLIGFDAFSKKVYERVRAGANYDMVFTNIMNFLKLKKKKHRIFPVVRISFVKNSINEHEIKKWFNFWKDKVDYLYVQEYRIPSLDDSKNYLIPKTNNGKDIILVGHMCHEPFERAVIRGNGAVLPCCYYFATKMPIGNIKYRDLKDIWYGEKALSLRQYFRDFRYFEHPICSQCLRTKLKLFE